MSALPQDLAPAHTLRLWLGDQLDLLHPWAQAEADAGRLHVLMEIRQETDYVLHHAQKILTVFAAMRRFAQALRERGHRVHYLRIGNRHNRQDLIANLEALAAACGARSVDLQPPDEWRLERQLRQWQARTPLRLQWAGNEHFYTERDTLSQRFGSQGPWRMELYYREMRRRHRVLLDAQGQPEGGRWNFDADNRAAWRGEPAAPPDRRPRHDLRELWAEIQAAGVASFGAPAAEAHRWPLDRAEALDLLAHFITDALPHFGRFQDALSDAEPRLFHALLSSALNLKLLRPQELVSAVEQAWRAGRVPIQAAEGFIRQILGWREYVRGVYWARMPGYESLNALGHERPLPAWFWTGRTQMRCLAVAIQASLQQAYAHHIQRLMVIGNFALLAGLAPPAVHAWYLGVYVDAFEWVELPNTLGMSQFSDGGLLATKPYTASAAYLQRMGDHCKRCPYDPKRKTGRNACPFNSLYWDFHLRHAERLRHNPRLAMVYRQLDTQDAESRAAVQAQARYWLEHLDVL